MKIAALFVSAFVAATLGMPLEHVQHEKRGDTQASVVVKLAAAAPTASVPVRIALKQRNLDRGMELLMEVSDPDSPKYGQHYTQQQIIDTFSPAKESVDAVQQWLVKAGIPAESISVPKSQGWVDFTTTVATLESLLKTSYHIYENTKKSGSSSSSHYLGADGYSLPSDIAPLVDFVWPAVSTSKVTPSIPVPKSRFRPLSASEIREMTADALSGCDSKLTPACIAALYDIPAAPKTADPSNRLGIFELGNEYHRQSDLDLFYSNVAKNVPKGTGPKIDLIDYGTTKPDPNGAEGEAALDFDMAIPIIYPQGTELFQVNGDSSPQFLDAVDGSYCDSDDKGNQCGVFTPTHVISFSYGGDEPKDTTKAAHRECNEYMKLGLQGTTVVWSSGDGGVAGGQGYDCLGANGDIFNPDDPAGCPYTLTVGATVLPAGSKPGDPETVTESFSPGGGFSNIYPVADYQKSAVDAYFADHDPGFPTYNTTENNIPLQGPGVYNRIGRGYPDVAAAGDNGVYAFNGRMGLNGGTSMSAPIVAAILNRINEERLAAGKKPVGFVNPAFYKNPAMFHDITRGRMNADDRSSCNGNSFSAVPGWDPVTGLGTPNYPAMSKYFAGL